MTPPFQCSRCNMSFESQEDLDQHNTRVHPMAHVPDGEPDSEIDDLTQDPGVRPDSATPEDTDAERPSRLF